MKTAFLTWIALLAGMACLAPGSAAAAASAASVPAAAASPASTSSAVVLKTCELKNDSGMVLGRARRYQVFLLLGRRPGLLEVRWPEKGKATPHRAWLPADCAAVVPGPPGRHHARLKRLKRARLPKVLVDRLLAGRIESGDNFFTVELAWGRPQRSFMVNYFNDEQHYVYFRPGGKRVLLRFVGGKLTQTPLGGGQ